MRILAVALAAQLGLAGGWDLAAGAGAEAMIHPARKPLPPAPTLPHRDVSVAGERGATLRGWLFPARGASRGLLVYLHGVADNRASGLWLAERYVARGYDVLLYDARAHGASTGDACTWGVLEKRDLSRVLDAVGARRVALVGVSMGAGVAIQAAALDPRIAGVVAAAPFSTLAALAREHAPAAAPEGLVQTAVETAEARGGFRVDDASPLGAAPHVRVPVLVVVGDRDEIVPLHHARAIVAALGGPRRLVVVPGAGHNDAIGRAWPEVDAWLSRALPDPGVPRGQPVAGSAPR